MRPSRADRWKFRLQKLWERMHTTDLILRASSLAFDLLMAAIPLALVFLQVATLFVADPMGAFYDLIQLLPETIGNIVSNILYALNNNVSAGSIGLGIFSAIWLGSNGVNKLMMGISLGLGFTGKRNSLFRRLASYVYTILLIVSIVLLLVLLVYSRAILHLVGQAMRKLDWKWLSWAMTILSSFAVKLVPLAFLFLTLLVFYISPPLISDGSLSLKAAALGASLASLGILGLTIVYGYILDNISQLSLYFGSFAGILGLFVWLKYVCVFLLLGAEFIALDPKRLEKKGQRPGHGSHPETNPRVLEGQGAAGEDQSQKKKDVH